MDVMLDTEVSLNVYRYPTDRAEYSFEVTLKKTNDDITLRVTLQANDSEVELEGYTHVYPADMDRKQPVTINLPDHRYYTCRVYQNGEESSHFEVGE